MPSAALEAASDGRASGRPLLSERLATRELGTLDGEALSEMLAAEAVDLLGGCRATVWIFRPALQRLFLDQRGLEVRSEPIGDDDVEELLACPAVWGIGADGLRYTLVEASPRPADRAARATTHGQLVGTLLVFPSEFGAILHGGGIEPRICWLA